MSSWELVNFFGGRKPLELPCHFLVEGSSGRFMGIDEKVVEEESRETIGWSSQVMGMVQEKRVVRA